MRRIAAVRLAALGVVLLVTASLVLYFFGPKLLGDRKTYTALSAEIEPADGAVIRGNEAWVRWSPSVRAKGRVLWRKAGESTFGAVKAEGEATLLARLGSLQQDTNYEYIVEQSAEGITQRSSVRTFTVKAGLGFDPPTVEQSISRDYDQTVTLTLRNDMNESITVAAKALALFEDLPADIVGPGSVDEPVAIEPGGRLNLRFAIAAADAARQFYAIPIEAAGTSALVRLRVAVPKLKIGFQVIGENPHTLAKTIELRNEGDAVADLAVRVIPPNDAEVRLEPRANHARLEKGQTLRLIASPILYLEFQSLDAELEASAAGQTISFPVQFNAPTGQRLIGVRTGSQKRSWSSDWYCTNRPTTCSNVSAPEGNGPESEPGR